jgi:flagella basal body P-ring formation protein FlgA
MQTRITPTYRFSLLLAGVLTTAAMIAQAQTASIDDVSESELVAPVTVQVAPVADAGMELFVPRNRITAIGMLELRHDAVVTGPQVKLREICRWSEDQSASFLPIADLVIDKLDSQRPKKILLTSLRQTLQDAGVDQGLIQFTGSTSCLVSAADSETNTPADDRTALNQWIDQSTKKAGEPVAAPTSNLPSAKLAADPATVIGSEVNSSDSFHTLRDLLLTDLSQRLNLPVDQMQMTVDPKDANLMNLSEPTFHFELEPQRVRDLGRVSWDVSILTGRSTQKVTISGEARAWEAQLIVARPASAKQVLRDEDVTERRALIDHIDDDPVLTRAQIVGQEASRDLRPGTVMTSRMVESVPLAKVGQYVSVKLTHGGIQVQTVAKAMEAGCFGQTIKVRNEETNAVFAVTLTGPQTGVMGTPQ